MHTRIRSGAFVFLLIFTAVTLCGCSRLTVMHLKRKPWVVNQPQVLDMKFWTFHFHSVPLTNKFGVHGTAYPVAEAVPEWVDRVDELWLAAYLSDSVGHVIAKSIRIYLPRAYTPQTGIDFEFILEPEDLGRAGQLYVTFGYRMILTGVDETASEEQSEPKVFFAKEGALNL